MDGIDGTGDVLRAVSWYVVLLFSLTLHEASHAFAARRGGDLTAYRGGQLSLDPRPHIRREPFGTVLVPLLSYAAAGWMIGWASTPFDPRWAAVHPRRAAWMSVAGPLANLGLVVAAGLAIRIGIAAGVFAVPEWIGFDHAVTAVPGFESLATLVSIAFTLNLLLCVFNLIPLPPLDGSGALALLLPDAVGRRVQAFLRQPRFAFAGLFVAWLLLGEIFSPIHGVAISLLYPEAAYQ